MKALICRDYTGVDDLTVETVPDPEPDAGQMLVDIKAAGINFPDILMVEGKYQFRPTPPFSPGAEAAGVVAELGEGVEGFAVGDRVIISTLHGAFAEKAIAVPQRAVKMPDSMDFNTGAGFTVTYSTSYHALKQRAAIQPGESLLVLGAAGGVGLSAVELGKAMGARVIAAASSDEKLDTAVAAGADERINYSTEDLKTRIKELTGGKGADVVYDPVGGELAEQALRATAWEGRFLVIDFASGTIPKVPLNLALLKGCQIVGVFWGSFAERTPHLHAQNTREMFDLFEAGKIKPLVSEAFALEDFKAAFATLSERRAKGKLVFAMG